MLEARLLAGRRGHALLFSGLSFTVGAGRALVVTGPNGSGKTTLLRMLAGLATPDAGELRLEGRALRPLDPALRGTVAYAGHLPALKDEFSARENLVSLTRLAGARLADASIAGALAQVGLASRADLPSKLLSAGQRRRVGLARLSLSRRRLWVLDEPLTALDAEGADHLARLASAHLAEGGAMVAATHQPLDIGAHAIDHLALGAA
jgi:heme exporter protein A